MKIENRNIKNILILFVPIFIIVFLIASTNTIEVISGLTVYMVTLLLIYFISFTLTKSLKVSLTKYLYCF